MLRSLTITKLDGYPRELKLNILNKKFEFSKGLNVIVGRNGSGKTTLLRCIKKAYHISKYSKCNEVGESKIELLPNIKYSIDYDFGPAVNGDLFYNDVDDTHDRLDLAAVDYAYAYERKRMSSGESKMTAQLYLKDYIESQDFRLMKKYYVGELSKDLFIVIDEPTLGMSAQIEKKFFEYMKDWGQVAQIVIASNTIFGLGIEGVNYIEMEDGYMNSQKSFVDDWCKNYCFNESK